MKIQPCANCGDVSVFESAELFLPNLGDLHERGLSGHSRNRDSNIWSIRSFWRNHGLCQSCKQGFFDRRQYYWRTPSTLGIFDCERHYSRDSIGNMCFTTVACPVWRFVAKAVQGDAQPADSRLGCHHCRHARFQFFKLGSGNKSVLLA